MTRLSLAFGASVLLAGGSASALGTFVSDTGSAVGLDASRTVFVRSAENVRMVTQVKYAGMPGKLLWMIAIPNFTTPDEDGVLVTDAAQAALDALSTSTRPTFTGECDGMPSGNMGASPQADTWGPTPNMALPQRLFTVQDILDGDLATYAESIGVTLDADAQTVIDTVVDQNYMLVTLRIDSDAIGVSKVDPIVSITFPRAAGEDIPLALFPTNTAAATGPADLVIFTLGDSRMAASLTTREVDFADVSFISPSETNYLPIFDQTVGALQTQMFVTEQAGGLDGAFGEPTLDGWIGESGATFHTRLRGRLGGPALRANKFISLTGAGMGVYDNTHAVAGFMCGGGEGGDGGMGEGGMGGDGGMGGEGGMGGAPEGGAGGDAPDAGTDGGSGGDGGGDGGGCSVSHNNPSAPWLLLGALLFPFRRRNR